MKALPIVEWLRSLERMEASLANTLADVDRHEAATVRLLAKAQPGAALDAATKLLNQLDDRLAEHDRRLASAAEMTASFDQALGKQESAIGHWREAFTAWSRRIQQGASGPPAELHSIL